jgi:hypothetical protein
VWTEDDKPMNHILDVDTIVDTSDIYKSGWTSTLDKLKLILQQKGEDVIQVAIGAAHTGMFLG